MLLVRCRPARRYPSELLQQYNIISPSHVQVRLTFSVSTAIMMGNLHNTQEFTNDYHKKTYRIPSHLSIRANRTPGGNPFLWYWDNRLFRRLFPALSYRMHFLSGRSLEPAPVVRRYSVLRSRYSPRLFLFPEAIPDSYSFQRRWLWYPLSHETLYYPGPSLWFFRCHQPGYIPPDSAIQKPSGAG